MMATKLCAISSHRARSPSPVMLIDRPSETGKTYVQTLGGQD
jgi:hypothetical protein